MAYSRKTRSRSAAGGRGRTRRSYRTSTRGRSYSPRRTRRAPARKRYRKTVKPQAIRIELVQGGSSDLSPLAQQMLAQRSETLPKKAKF